VVLRVIASSTLNLGKYPFRAIESRTAARIVLSAMSMRAGRRINLPANSNRTCRHFEGQGKRSIQRGAIHCILN
jgi:hypothetical protein